MPLIVLPVVLPPVAVAQTRMNAEILLEPSADESYKVFIARAEANAAVKVQSLFDQDLLRTEVRVTVLGQRSAAIAPVLRLQVSRREWTAYPDPEIWSKYFPESRNLLLFNAPATSEPTPETLPEVDLSTTPATQDKVPTVFEDQVPTTNEEESSSATTEDVTGETDLEGTEAEVTSEAGTNTESTEAEATQESGEATETDEIPEIVEE